MTLTQLAVQGATPPSARRQSRAIDAAFVLVLLVALVSIVTNAPAMLRVPVVLVAMLICPGYAVVRNIGSLAVPEAVAITIATSLSANTLVAYSEAVTGWWHPTGTAVAIFGLSTASLLRKPGRQDGGESGLSLDSPAEVGGTGAQDDDFGGKALIVALTLVAVAAIVGWLFAIGVTGPVVKHIEMGFWGLIPILPGYWYIGLAAVVSGCILAQDVVGKAHRRLSSLFTAMLILYLYATAPALEGTPRFTWVYKHLGVVRYILENHQVDARIDIYHRWPGMFSIAGMFTTLSGSKDPTSYATWSELAFTLLDVILLYPFARRLTGPREAWVACYFFIVFNWVGQQYFSPQALAFTLSLALLLIVAMLLPVGAPPALAVRLLSRGGLAGRFLQSGPRESSTRPPEARTYLLCVAVLIDAAIVVSHQLTPYILLLSIALLTASHLLRPKWLVVAMAAITFGYLMPNLGFVEHRYGLFNGLSLLDNAKSPPSIGSLAETKQLQGHLALGLTLLAWLTAVAGVLSGGARRPLFSARSAVALLFASPFFLLLVQDYGGEARMRVLLFSLPMCSIGAAWLWDRNRVPGNQLWRWTAITAMLPVSTVLSICVTFGGEDLNYVPATEVSAANWLSKNALRGEVIMSSTAGSPTRYGADYASHPGPAGDYAPTLEVDPDFAKRDFAREAPNVQSVAGIMRLYSSHGYLVFSSTQARFARANGALGGLAGYRNLESSVSKSTIFRVVYSNADTTVYQLK